MWSLGGRKYFPKASADKTEERVELTLILEAFYGKDNRTLFRPWTHG